MFRKGVLVGCVAVIGFVCAVGIYGQDATSLAAALDKNKYKQKEKSKNGVNVSIEMYVDIKNEPVVKQPAEYSGRYRDEFGGFSLDLRVAGNGQAEGSGVDTCDGDMDATKTAFTLKNAWVKNAVLTGEKVFADGTTEKFEGVFVNRTTQQGKNANAIETQNTEFGLGFVQKNGKMTNRVFLAAK